MVNNLDHEQIDYAGGAQVPPPQREHSNQFSLCMFFLWQMLPVEKQKCRRAKDQKSRDVRIKQRMTKAQKQDKQKRRKTEKHRSRKAKKQTIKAEKWRNRKNGEAAK